MAHIEIRDLNSARFAVAMDMLRNGFSFRYRDVDFWLGEGRLNVISESSWELENMTHPGMLEDFERGRVVLEELTAFSKQFAELATRYPVRFILAQGTGEKGYGGWVATWTDGRVEWLIPTPPFL